ncbi:MAG: hypothetical protein IJA63_09125 [Akkermansia sp.]|nr:hypothetical protein [Akkermansia sp.]
MPNPYKVQLLAKFARTVESATASDTDSVGGSGNGSGTAPENVYSANKTAFNLL